MGSLSYINSTCKKIRDCGNPQDSQIALTVLVSIIPESARDLFRQAGDSPVPFASKGPHSAKHVSLVKRKRKGGSGYVEPPLLAIPVSTQHGARTGPSGPASGGSLVDSKSDCHQADST